MNKIQQGFSNNTEMLTITEMYYLHLEKVIYIWFCVANTFIAKTVVSVIVYCCHMFTWQKLNA